MNRYDQRMRELNAELYRVDAGVRPILLDEKDLQQVEAELGHVLPGDYREFLRCYGCYVIYAFFKYPESEMPASDGVTSGCIEVFYGVRAKANDPSLIAPTLDLLCNYRSKQDLGPPEMLPEMLPIGDFCGATPTCIALWGKNAGYVYNWDRQMDSGTNGYEHFYLVAHSFDEFMNSLMTEEGFNALEE